jgi:hypothetical protein
MHAGIVVDALHGDLEPGRVAVEEDVVGESGRRRSLRPRALLQKAAAASRSSDGGQSMMRPPSWLLWGMVCLTLYGLLARPPNISAK